MAAWDGGGDTGLSLPPSNLDAVDEENVIRETEDVVKNFMVESYRHDSLDTESEVVSSTPYVPELTNFTAFPLSREARVGRQLAIIGDDINDRYEHVFNQMIVSLQLSPDTAYEAFAGVARKLFSNGINWGRILTLLCFGYRIAIQVLRSRTTAFTNFINKIIKYVVKFIITEKIAKWIADHGGWIAALAQDAIPSLGTSTFAFILGLGLALAFMIWMSKTRTG